MPTLFMKSLRGRTLRRLVSTDDLERMKKLARRLKKAENLPHHEALERIARHAHLDNWHQVVTANKEMLPTEQAIREGIVVAMDPKDCEWQDELHPKSPVGRFVADRILGALLKESIFQMEQEGIDEEDGRPNREKWSEAELREFVDEYMQELVFYRFEGDDPPETLQQVIDLVNEAVFFGPLCVWIKGKCLLYRL